MRRHKGRIGKSFQAAFSIGLIPYHMCEHISVRINPGFVPLIIYLSICQDLSSGGYNASPYNSVFCLVLSAVIRTADNVLSFPNIEVYQISDKRNKNQHKKAADD